MLNTRDIATTALTDWKSSSIKDQEVAVNSVWNGLELWLSSHNYISALYKSLSDFMFIAFLPDGGFYKYELNHK